MRPTNSPSSLSPTPRTPPSAASASPESPSPTTTDQRRMFRARRLAARIIDEALVAAVQFPCIVAAAWLSSMSVIAKPGSEDSVNDVAVGILLLGWIITAGYELGATWSGASVGKALTQLAVIDTRSGSHPTLSQAAIRWLLLSSMQPLVWLWLLFPPDDANERTRLMIVFVTALAWRSMLGLSALAAPSGRGIHDLVCRTAVMLVARPTQRDTRRSPARSEPQPLA
ncbi:MAG: RDD family protein [Acidimicrobiales bacterium]